MKTEQRQVSNFDSIALSGVGEVDIAQTGTPGLTIQAEDNILPLLTSDVQGTQLRLGMKAGNTVQPTQPIRFLVTVDKLNAISSSGAGAIIAPALNQSDLHISTSGAGSITLSNLTGQTLAVTLSGAGEVVIGGRVQSQTITLSGVGSYKGDDLTSQQAVVKVSGVGSATVRASDTLDATVSGVGSIEYYGSPTVTKKVSGVGSVKQHQ